MQNNFTLRWIEKNDAVLLSEFFSEVFTIKKDSGYCQWKYFQNPIGENMSMVAVDDGKIVGNFGVIPARIKVGTNSVLASQGVDTAISESYRQKSTFFDLAGFVKEKMLARGVQFSFVFSNKYSYLIFSRFFNFYEVCQIFSMKKVLNPAPYLQKKIKLSSLSNFCGSIYTTWISWTNRTKMKWKHSYSLRLGEVQRFDERFDLFWQNQAKCYEIACVRDSQYLNWRYVQNPFDYKIFCIESEKDLSIKGYMVLGCYDEDIRRGRIIDIMVEAGNNQAMEMLIRKAICYFLDKQADIISCWMLDQWPAFEILKKFGFILRNTENALIVRSWKNDLDNQYLADRSKWYLTMGDSDYF